MCLQRWLNIVLDLVVAGIAVGVISIAIAFRGTMTGGQIGVALNMILLANKTLLTLVTSFTNLEISLGAIARLKERFKRPHKKMDWKRIMPFRVGASAGAVNVDDLECPICKF
jgi:ATP-binding cassette, subfamily C (CFTR/MRP), member 1